MVVTAIHHRGSFTTFGHWRLLLISLLRSFTTTGMDGAIIVCTYPDDMSLLSYSDDVSLPQVINKTLCFSKISSTKLVPMTCRWNRGTHANDTYATPILTYPDKHTATTCRRYTLWRRKSSVSEIVVAVGG